MKNKSLTNKDGEVRELSRDYIRNMKPAKEILPKDFQQLLKNKTPKK